ncbi:MAG: hypothetical protein NTW21_39140 [Verrucomicrobia bacterium]|nr:hypothetical protein [Verrucomicrobiota bacterium]
MRSTDNLFTDNLFSDNPHLRGGLLVWGLWVPTWVIVLLVVLVALLGLGFAIKPANQIYREYRLKQNLEAARVAANLEDWSTARDKAHEVLLVRQHDLEASRIWTRALYMRGEPNAYLAATQLFNDPQALREDRLEALQMLALQAPQALALGAFASLPDELRKQAAFRAAITPLLVLRGEAAVAEQRLREVMQPTDGPAVRLELLRTLCCRPDDSRLAEARRIFTEFIAANASTEALAALLLLGDIPHALGPALPDLPTWVEAQPMARALHHLVAMQPALEAKPESAERLYAEAIKRFVATDPGVLGTWLMRHNQTDKAAEILKEPAITKPDAYFARLAALSLLRNQEAIEAALIAPPASVDPVDIEIARAQLEWLRDKPNAAVTALISASNQAAFDTKHNRFIEIAQLAERHDARAVATDAWVAAIRVGWGRLPLYSDLHQVIEFLVDKDRTEDLLALCQTLLRFEPDNPELRNHFHYLALIDGLLPPAEVVTAQTKLIAENPQASGFNTTLMLAEILSQRPHDALSRLPQLRACTEVEPMLKTALEGSARVSAGETEAGTALLQQVDWGVLMRQERRVFHNLLTSLSFDFSQTPNTP